MEALVAIAFALLTFLLAVLRLNRDADRDYVKELRERLVLTERDRDLYKAEMAAKDREIARLERERSHLWRELDQYEKRGQT